MRNVIWAIFMLLPLMGVSQNQADWWYFGSNAGMHFTSSGPVPDGNGQLVTAEGNSSISDANGDLLFYTDGSTVYDKNHNVMPNGTGLFGNSSSTHSGVIFPAPSNPDWYYLFTIDAGVGQGMHYTKVDMTLNSGNGDVVTTEKNVFLLDGTSEKIAGTSKTGGFWAITHKSGTDEYYAFEITATGVNTTPVVSSTGWATSGFGYGVKASRSGTKIAAVYFSTDSIHLYDFNLQTGVVTADKKVGSSMTFSQMYGLEFSPNEEVLYMQSYATCDVRQFDLTLGTSAAISASELVIGNTGTGGGQLQLGPDKKIYCARNMQGFLSSIENPNVIGTGCNWVDTSLVLSTGTSSRWGLTAFIPSFFLDGIIAEDHCFGETITFGIDSSNVDSVFWNFGDPTSGTADTSTQYDPTHTYTDTGLFTVTLIARSALDSVLDTVYKDIYVYPHQSMDLGDDTLLCSGDSLVLNIAQDFSTYLWQDSSTADSFVVYEDSLIYATLFGVCDTITDTIQVTFDDSIKFELGNDTLFCVGNSLELDAEITVNASMFWSTGDTVDSIFVTTSGTYELNAFNACGPFTDTINITVVPLPDTALLPPDTLNCFDVSILLERPNLDGVTYVWSDSSSKKTYQVDTTELVWLAAFNECGFSVDTMNLVFNGEIKTELGEDTTICPEDSVMMIATSYPEATYVWNTGDTTDTLRNLVDESKNYIVTVTYKQCQKIESKRVDLDELVCPTINCDVNFANVITPNADGINDIFRVWSDCAIEEYTLSIYNRWGQLVHYSNTANFGWDGYVNGELVTPGVYFFEMTFRDQVVVNVDQDYFRGSFTILR